MRRRSFIGTGFYHALTGVLMVPFLLVSLIAAGTMPVRVAGGMVEIVICIDNSFRTISVPADEAPPGQTPVDHAACPWDKAAPAVTLGFAPSLPHLVAILSPASFAPERQTAPSRQQSAQVSNRGPPAQL